MLLSIGFRQSAARFPGAALAHHLPPGAAPLAAGGVEKAI
jgi:hypothetical protein